MTDSRPDANGRVSPQLLGAALDRLAHSIMRTELAASLYHEAAEHDADEETCSLGNCPLFRDAIKSDRESLEIFRGTVR